MDTIISSSISAMGALVICLLTSYATQKKTEALLVYRISALEGEVKELKEMIMDTFLSRIHECEKRLDVVDEKIKDLAGRVDDLK